MSAYQTWQRASEGLVSFMFVETPEEADMKCYFKNPSDSPSIGAQSFEVKGDIIEGSTINFKRLMKRSIILIQNSSSLLPCRK